MKGWTAEHIEKLRNKGMLAGSVPGTNKTVPRTKLKPFPIPEAAGLRDIKQKLHVLDICYETEYKFLEDRGFRFDIALPKHKIAIEYEGLFSKKSGHTTIDGFLSDVEKYNLAVINGWRLLRYTQKDYERAIGDIFKLLNR